MTKLDGLGQLLNDDGTVMTDCEFHETWDDDGSFTDGFIVCPGTREDYPIGLYRLLRGSVETTIRITGYLAWVEGLDSAIVTIAYVPIETQ